jgi:hypothetical protein
MSPQFVEFDGYWSIFNCLKGGKSCFVFEVCVCVDTVADEGVSDEHDDSLRKWKESLGLGTGISDPSDPRTCIILSLGLEVSVRRPSLSFEANTYREPGRGSGRHNY